MTHPVNIATENLIGIKEHANSEANIKDLLMKASRSELLLYVALRPHSATLKAIRSHENPRQSSFKTKDVFYAPLLPHYARLMAEFGEAVIEQYEASVEGKAPLDWHYWMLDAPQTVTTEQVKIDKTLIEALPITQADTAHAKAEPIKGVSKKVIQRVFADLHFDYAKWGSNLANAPKWLTPCRVSRGSKASRVSHTWNPALIGLALMDKGITIKQLDLAFMGLKDWKDEWQEKTDSMR